jgi:hypothetical protein
VALALAVGLASLDPPYVGVEAIDGSMALQTSLNRRSSLRNSSERLPGVA